MEYEKAYKMGKEAGEASHWKPSEEQMNALQVAAMIKILVTWILISTSTTATVYNAVPEQCGSNPTRTASGRKIDAARVADLRILAMERTMMTRNGIHYGDTVRVEGAGKYDGLWIVEDTMSSRYAGQDRIDFLVPETIRTGLWKGVRIYAKKSCDNDL